MKKYLSLILVMSLGCAHAKFFTGEMYRAYDAFEEVKKITYKADEDDYWQTPEETKILGRGDCEDQALYLQRLLLDNGIRSIVMFGATNKDDKELHVWNEAIIHNREYILDVTNNIFEKRSVLSDKYPGSYDYVPLTAVEENRFAVNVKSLRDRLWNSDEKTDLIRFIRK